MSTTQIHLALNHIPVLLSITGAIVLTYALIRKNSSVKYTGLSLLIAAALFTLPVYFSGEGTEESVEHLPGISENLIEEHAEMALIAFILIVATGVIALSSVLLKKRQVLSRNIAFFSLMVAFVSFGAFAQTARLGGQIRHSELRGSIVQQDINPIHGDGENSEDD
jgi:hypothetical protein